MNWIRRISIGLVCALTALALSGCAGGGANGGDQVTKYGSNGTRLLERDHDSARDWLPGTDDAGRILPGERRSGVSRGGAGASGERPDGGRVGTGARDGGQATGHRDAGRDGFIGNGYDGITPDGAGTSDPKRAAAESAAGGVSLQIGGIRITDAEGESGDGARVLRVTSPAARKALVRLNRNLASGRPSDRADEIAKDLLIVLKDAR